MAYKPKNSVKSLCSGSPITNLKSGGRMISSDKGSSNYMKEDPGSPAKALKPEIKNFFSSLGSKIIYQLGTSPNEKARDKARALGLKNNNTTSVNKDIVGPKDSGQSSTNKPAPDVFKGDFSDPNKTSAGPAPTVKPSKKAEIVGSVKASSKKDNTPSAAQTAASKLEQRAKTAISKRKKARKTKDGVNAVIEHQNKKKAASKIKDTKTKSKAEIRSAKTTAKQAGKSKQEIRLAKTKAKAKNARIETTSKETAAQGGKKAQEKRAKTIRLEKRAKRIEGRIAKRKAKK